MLALLVLFHALTPTIQGQFGCPLVSSTSTCAATCDAGYGTTADGGCDLIIPACSPDLGRYSDAGCVLASWATSYELCDVMADAGLLSGNWWCVRGDQTMLAGSHLTMWPFSGDGGTVPTQSWSKLPGGTFEVMTRLNDTTATASWNQFFMSDSGIASPTGNFSTCMLFANASNNNLAPGAQSGVCQNGMVRYGTTTNSWYHEETACVETIPAGDKVTCTGGTGDCSESTVSGQGTPRRSFGLHCGTFTASTDAGNNGSTSACTYVQGATNADGGGTVNCTSAAHPRMSIKAGTTQWFAGYGDVAAISLQGSGAGMANGWFAGAFMTEQVLTAAQQATIGAATLPGTRADQTFVRASDETCCDSVPRCNNLPPNVACGTGAVVQVSASRVKNTAGAPEGVMTLSGVSTATDGGTMVAVSTLNDHASPFGFTTAIKYAFPATRVTISDAGVPYAWSESAATGCQSGAKDTVTCSWYVFGPGTTLDMCLSATAPAQTCGLCSPGAGWTYCSVTALADGTTTQCVIGNLTQTAPTASLPDNSSHTQGSNHVVRPDQSVWITAIQCDPLSNATDYSFLGTSTSRQAETCTGTGCP